MIYLLPWSPRYSYFKGGRYRNFVERAFGSVRLGKVLSGLAMRAAISAKAATYSGRAVSGRMSRLLVQQREEARGSHG